MLHRVKLLFLNCHLSLSVILMGIVGLPVSGAVLIPLPVKDNPFSISDVDFQHYIFTGTQHDTVFTRGNFGVSMPLLAYVPLEQKRYDFGIAAQAHLVMIPRDLKFAVDNLYAVLALYISGKESPFFSWRLYPVYHLSAHLADGHAGGIDADSVHAISSEMAKGEVILSPVKALEISAAYGRYYHTCFQRNLTDRMNLDAQWAPHIYRWLQPFIRLQNEIVRLGTWHYSFDSAAGVRFTDANHRAVALSVRYFNRMNPGYFFEQREQSLGTQIEFDP